MYSRTLWSRRSVEVSRWGGVGRGEQMSTELRRGAWMCLELGGKVSSVTWCSVTLNVGMACDIIFSRMNCWPTSPSWTCITSQQLELPAITVGSAESSTDQSVHVTKKVGRD
jgi:hypothetical protein